MQAVSSVLAAVGLFLLPWCGSAAAEGVDWGMLFPEEGTAQAVAREPAAPEPAPAEDAAPAPAEPSRNAARPQVAPAAVEQPPPPAPRRRAAQASAPPRRRGAAGLAAQRKERAAESARLRPAQPARVAREDERPSPVAPPTRHQAPAAETERADVPGPGGDAPIAAREGSDLVPLAALGLSPGQVLDESNYTQYAEWLTPGVQWGIVQGWRLEVTEPTRIEFPRAYREATEKYAGQVRLRKDGLALENYVAGLPFPHVDPNDPQAVMKIMWNFYYGFEVTDDVTQRYFEPRTGTVGRNEALSVERFYLVDAYRRLNYNGRVVVDPKPELPNPQRVRFKESVHPILEPYDLKGMGATFYRYLDPDKQDDSWVFLPQLRRVRRLSSAQRSDSLFGQDTDADSFHGYNGHIAWMDYRLLGERTILATMHARHTPIRWQKPEDWLWSDVWEPRRVWVVEAVSRNAQYAFSKRVLYIDKQSYLIPFSDNYDRAGQLWKTLAIAWSLRREALPGRSRLAVYQDAWPFQNAFIIFDTQLQHATCTDVPNERSARMGEEGFLINLGRKAGVSDDFFSIAHLIEAAG